MLGNVSDDTEEFEDVLPSQFIMTIIDTLCGAYPSLTPLMLWDISIDKLFDLYVDVVLFKRREQEEKDDTKTQYVFVPAKKSIKETGLY